MPNWDVVILVVLLAGAAGYAAALIRLWRHADGRGLRRWPVVAFGAGWSVLAIALLSQLATAVLFVFLTRGLTPPVTPVWDTPSMTRIETHGHGWTAKVVDLAAYRQSRARVSGRPVVQTPPPGSRVLSPRQAVHRRRMLAHLVDLAVRR